MARNVSRRTVLFGGTALAAVAAIPVVTSLLPADPPDGPELPEFPELTGELVAAPLGDRLAYSGHVPGPLLRVREGEQVRLPFHNALDVPTSLHIHGLPLAPDVDAPLKHLMPGEMDHREFTVPHGTAGTYWYHPHAHGDVERQLLAGLAGPIIVEEATPRIQADDRLLMVTRDLAVNGVQRPVITPRSGRVRLRLINATAADYLLLGLFKDAERVTFHQIAADGGLIGQPLPLNEILLTPGERAEILVDTTTAGRLELRALPYSVYGPNGTPSEDRLLASLNVPPSLAPVALPGTLRTIEPPAAAVRTRRLVLNGQDGSVFTIDGRTFDHSRVDIQARPGTTEIWELVNDHTMDHPFHLHSYSFQMLGGIPAWRDTVNVPARGSVRIAIPFHGPPGRTVYHCHIASHEDLGMMGILEVG